MFAFSKKSTTPKAPRFLPEVQALEDRCLLSVSSSFSNGTLRLDGNSSADAVNVTHDGNGRVTGRATNIRSINQTGVKKLIISTGGGRDNITFTQTGDLTRDFTLDVRGGDDIDRCTATLQGDILSGRTMKMTLDGGKNSDSLLQVIATQDVDVQANAKLLVILEGGPSGFLGSDSDDRMACFYQGQVLGTLDVDFSGGSGNDNLTGELRLDVGSTGRIGEGKSRMSGGNDKDRMTFLISDLSTATISAEVDGGTNTDNGTHTTNVLAIALEQNDVVNFQ